VTTAGTEADGEKERLTALGGLAALSLDALSSVAYGPEAILVVLVAAGTVGLKYSLPITGAIVVLLAVLIVSYRQVIGAFPNGGGAYAVSKRHLGTDPALVAAASLIVDYVLNAAVGVSAGVEALTAAFPGLYGVRVWLCLGVLAALTGVNLWGIAESAVIELVSKFVAGAWLVALVIPLLVLLFTAVRRAYARIGVELAIGQVPPPPVKQESLVIVPVSGMSRLTAEGISVAMSLGDDVIAVTVVYTDAESDSDTASGSDPDDGQQPDVSFREEWQRWRPEVPLLTLRSPLPPGDPNFFRR
jgi:hypothetical protein